MTIYCEYFQSDQFFFIQKAVNTLLDLNLKEWQALATIVYGAVALSLGYIYFSRKLTVDNEVSANDRARKRLIYLLEQLDRIDAIAIKILNLDFDNNKHLKRAREELDRVLLLIDLYLDNNDKLLKLTTKELDVMVKVHSYISNSVIISEMTYDDLSETNCIEEYYSYIDVTQDARSVCLQKEELY